jgi:hypothetical protein
MRELKFDVNDLKNRLWMSAILCCYGLLSMDWKPRMIKKNSRVDGRSFISHPNGFAFRSYDVLPSLSKHFGSSKIEVRAVNSYEREEIELSQFHACKSFEEWEVQIELRLPAPQHDECESNWMSSDVSLTSINWLQSTVFFPGSSVSSQIYGSG